MRSTLLGVVATALLTANSFAAHRPTEEILALHGDALSEAADEACKAEVPSRDLIKMIKKLAFEPRVDDETTEHQFALPHCFEKACAIATAAELQQLVEIYLQFDSESFEKQYLFCPLAARLAQEEVKRLDVPENLLPKSTAPPVPAELRRYPQVLIDAWKFYRAMVSPVERTIYSKSANRSLISFQANKAAFFKLLDDVLLKRTSGLAERLVAFEWTGVSGTGNQLVTGPRSAAIFLALLREHRIDEALGAAFRIEDEDAIRVGSYDVRIALLKRCHLDWETAYAGAEIDAERTDFGSYELEELAAFGSNHAAALICLMAKYAKPDLREIYAHAIAAFLSSDPRPPVHFLNGAYDRVSGERLSPSNRKSLVDLLVEFVTPDVQSDLAAAVLDGFARAPLPETKSALHSLTQRSSPALRGEAAETLRSMGETIASPAPTASTRIRILVNGKRLLSQSRILVVVGNETHTDEVRDDGTIQIENPHSSKTTLHPSKGRISGEQSTRPEEPVFNVEFPLPHVDGSVLDVNITATSIPLTIHAPNEKNAAKDLRPTVRLIRLSAENSNSENRDDALFAEMPKKEFSVPFGQATKLLLQRAAYRLTVTASGAALFQKQFVVRSQPTSWDIMLTKGSDLKYEIHRPDGERRAPLQLLRDNQELSPAHYDLKTRTFRWLPPGRYVLHIASSKAVRSEGGIFKDYAPAQTPWAERDISFVVTNDSPPVINLGNIFLAPDSE